MKTLSVASLLLSLLVASQAQADLRYKVQTTTEGGPRGKGTKQVMQMTATGEKARMEFLEGAPFKDGYLITKDGAKTMTMVNPEDKTYMNWDMGAMMGMAGAMMKMDVTDPKMEKLLDEPGQPILGYPTRHYKFRISYGMSVTIMGITPAATQVVRDEETWTTTKIDTAALGRWLKNTPKVNESLDKLIAMERGRMEGMPLKMISVNTTTDQKGKAQTSKTLMEVLEIENMTASPSLFEIPAGYTEVQMGGGQEGASEGGSGKGMPPGMPAGLMKMFGK